MDKIRIPKTTARKLDRLKSILKRMRRVVVAFSGGVDSTLLLKVAHDVLGKNVLAVVARSETYPGREVSDALKLAGRLRVWHRLIHTRELENPAFSSNPPQRCYYCKLELFSELKKIADENGIPYVLDGSNYEDRRDFRPGEKAGRELGIRSPLREARLLKREIRLLSRLLGLPTWDKPSFACLASRFPYETRIEREGLRQVGAAEETLLELGFKQFRVRHHGRIARIEIEPSDFPRILTLGLREKLIGRLKALGYTYVSLDLEGYRTGSMNEPLRRIVKSEKGKGRNRKQKQVVKRQTSNVKLKHNG